MIYFRADANEKIAAGHVMRCLSLAKAFRKLGRESIFLSADENPKKLVETNGFSFRSVNSSWDDLTEELPLMGQILDTQKNPLLIVDTYQISRDYVESLLPHGRICYLGSKKEYLGPLSAIINYSSNIDRDFYADKYSEDGTLLLLGVGYAPLRDGFSCPLPRKRSKAEHILVTTGSSDPYSITGQLLPLLLEREELQETIFDVVIGPLFGENAPKLSPHEHRVQLHHNPPSMLPLMERADLAVSANGTTVYELAAMGVPVISFAMTEEQEESALGMEKLGVVSYCGKYDAESPQQLSAKILEQTVFYAKHHRERMSLAEKAHSAIDGKGAMRVAKKLLEIIESPGKKGERA